LGGTGSLSILRVSEGFLSHRHCKRKEKIATIGRHINLTYRDAIVHITYNATPLGALVVGAPHMHSGQHRCCLSKSQRKSSFLVCFGGEHNCRPCCSPYSVGANQLVHWFLGGKGLGIQLGTSIWVASPKSSILVGHLHNPPSLGPTTPIQIKMLAFTRVGTTRFFLQLGFFLLFFLPKTQSYEVQQVRFYSVFWVFFWVFLGLFVFWLH
jgi:hypothetical protein